MAYLKMMFLFPRWERLISWRVLSCFVGKKFERTQFVVSPPLGDQPENCQAAKLRKVSRSLGTRWGIFIHVHKGVSKNSGTVPPKSSNFNRVFHYKPSILGYPYFWKHPITFKRNVVFCTILELEMNRSTVRPLILK